MPDAGRWSTAEYQGGWTDDLSPAYAAYVKAQLEEASKLVTATGARMVFLTAPCTGRGGAAGRGAVARGQPGAPGGVQQAGTRGGGGAPQTDSVVDLDAAACPGGKFSSTVDGVAIRRTDGIHFTNAGGVVLAPELMPPIVAAGRAQVASAGGAPSAGG